MTDFLFLVTDFLSTATDFLFRATDYRSLVTNLSSSMTDFLTATVRAKSVDLFGVLFDFGRARDRHHIIERYDDQSLIVLGRPVPRELADRLEQRFLDLLRAAVAAV